tara:strand:- start:14512 stop:15081 length:570 start_codon:yes stop_codon:yes gene_type:complete
MGFTTASRDGALNQTLPIELQQALNVVAHKYARLVEKNIRQKLEKRKDTGALGLSVKAVVIPAQNDSASIIKINYSQYGQFMGASRLIYTKLPPVKEIAEQLRRKNRWRRDFVPGYTQGVVPKISDEKIISRIAFAVAKALRKRERFDRRYKWKREALPDLLRNMNAELLTAWAKETENLIAQSLTIKH